ncbi:MAG: hypothetical protein ACKKL6_01715 [Candidatus Komeilibacteria bacterium]
MNLEKWEQIKAMAKDKFDITREHEEEGVDGIGKVEILEFNGPLGRMKLEFITKPRILDKKTSYSNRIGSDVKVDYVYSEDEETCQLVAYKWDEGAEAWESIDASAFT